MTSSDSVSKSRRFLVDAPRKRWMAWSSSPATVDVLLLAGQESQEQALGEAHVLELVDQHVAEALGQAGAHVRALATIRKACSTRSPKSSVPASASIRSWAAKMAANSRSRIARPPSASSGSLSAQAA